MRAFLRKVCCTVKKALINICVVASVIRRRCTNLFMQIMQGQTWSLKNYIFIMLCYLQIRNSLKKSLLRYPCYFSHSHSYLVSLSPGPFQPFQCSLFNQHATLKSWEWVLLHIFAPPSLLFCLPVSPWLGLRGEGSSANIRHRSNSRPAAILGLWPSAEALPGVRCEGVGHCSVCGRRHLYPSWGSSSSK